MVEYYLLKVVYHYSATSSYHTKKESQDTHTEQTAEGEELHHPSLSDLFSTYLYL